MVGACKKRVYKRICEDENGKRTGRFGKVRYESAWKGGRKTKPATKTGTKKRAVKKAARRNMKVRA